MGCRRQLRRHQRLLASVKTTTLFIKSAGDSHESPAALLFFNNLWYNLFMNNLLPEQNPPKNDSPRVVFLLLGALIFLVISASLGGMLFASSAGFKPATILAKLRSLTLAREKVLQGEEQNRINVLLLGMGGIGHEGATLTDTIVFTSFQPSNGNVSMLSIPRDLQVNIPKYGYYRINNVNAYAERDNPGTGGEAAANMVTQILDQPVHYYLRVDFAAFKEIVDTVGGIEVDVDRAFYDPFYPDNNFGYAPVAFEDGKQTMDGERALKFVRSRHGTNGEGNDFARARRQQKVLFSLKERLLSFDVLLRPKRIRDIFESLDNHVQTNIAFWEGMRFANMLRSINTEQIQSVVLDASPQGVLRERNYNGAFVLEPKSRTWDEVRMIAKNLFNPAFIPPGQTPTTSTGEIIVAEPTSPPLIEIQNGTTVNGLAGRTAAQLEIKGFDPISIGNASVRDVENTMVYDLTGNTKPEQFETLKNELSAVEGEGEPMHILRKGKLDFLVILGKDRVE